MQKPAKDETNYYIRPDVYGLELIHANFVKHAFARHSHDYFAIGIIERGLQTFSAKGGKNLTPTGGVIVLNPGEWHTGESANDNGFTYRAFYPSLEALQVVASEITGKPQAIPFFRDLVITDPRLTHHLLNLHYRLAAPAPVLEGETQFLTAFAYLIKHYAETRYRLQAIGDEPQAIRLVREYLESNFAEDVSLNDLAQLVALSPYYLARVFQAEVGLPPHAYLETVRIRQAQKLLSLGYNPAFVAQEVGFTDQSHFTHRFRRLIGVTPGQYQQQRKILQDSTP